MTDFNDPFQEDPFGLFPHRRMQGTPPGLDVTLPPAPEVPPALRGPAYGAGQASLAVSSDTQWNGEPCQALRATAVVADDERFPQYWARHLVGTRRNVVQVQYAGAMFYLDDEDGSGWHKVTHGGSPRWAHSNLTVDPLTVELRQAPAGPDGEAAAGDDVHVLAAAITRVRELHRPVDYYGELICAECSAYDGDASTDKPSVPYADCTTLAALATPKDK